MPRVVKALAADLDASRPPAHLPHDRLHAQPPAALDDARGEPVEQRPVAFAQPGLRAVHLAAAPFLRDRAGAGARRIRGVEALHHQPRESARQRGEARAAQELLE